MLNTRQQGAYDAFRAFAARYVEPCAAQWDHDQRLPLAALAQLAASGYLGWTIPEKYGGAGRDVVSFGLLNEALGRVSPALTGVLTVQTMVSIALVRWGTDAQKREWLPRLADGQLIAGFALTEPGGGSDLEHQRTEFVRRNGHLVLNGTKRWISCGQFAGVFLVFGRLDGLATAALVPVRSPGVRIDPITDLMGFRAAGLAQLDFEEVEVPIGNVVGKPGFGLSHVGQIGLHYGRISTACSALGLLRGCFEESIAWAAARRIGDERLGDLGMARSLISRMGTDLEAATALCRDACLTEEEHRSDAFERTLIAKYFTSRAAVRAASDAVQLHGAAGCHHSSPVSRYYRDSKIMEVIEGTTQVHEDLLGRIFVDRADTSSAAIGVA